MSNMIRRYCLTITENTKWQFTQKVKAEDIFKGKKQSYPYSIRDPFVDSRLGKGEMLNFLYNYIL